MQCPSMEGSRKTITRKHQGHATPNTQKGKKVGSLFINKRPVLSLQVHQFQRDNSWNK